MITAEPRTRSARAGEHLQLLRLLASELERAMGAIAGNNLHELEDSIQHQQTLSAQLSTLADEIRFSGQEQQSFHSDSIEPGLIDQIRGAQEQLRRLNHRYSILLQHSSRSVALMVSLFNSLRGQYREAPGAGLKLQTWSCQV